MSFEAILLYRGIDFPSARWLAECFNEAL